MSIDRTLIAEGLVTAEQLLEIQDLIRRRGGKLVDHLYSTRVADERTLLSIVESQHSWKTVELGHRPIPEDVLSRIPAALAWELKILPFEYSQSDSTLLIACDDPDDSVLIERLSNEPDVPDFELFAAIGVVLRCSIIEHYRDLKPATTTDESTESGDAVDEKPNARDIFEESVIILSNRWDIDRHFGTALVNDGYRVVLVDSSRDLQKEIENTPSAKILMRRSKKELEGECPTAWLQDSDIAMRRFTNIGELLDESKNLKDCVSFLASNLRLAASILSRTGEGAEQTIRVGPLVERVCKRLNLSAEHSMVTVTAGYMQDFASLYFGSRKPTDRESALFQLLATVDNKLVYPPSVLSVIREMYQNVSGQTGERSTYRQTVNANIVTIVDFYCSHFPNDVAFSPHQYEIVASHLRSLEWEILLPRVVDAFLDVIQEEVVIPTRDSSAKYLITLNQTEIDNDELSTFLSEQGCDSLIVGTVDELAARFQQCEPDVLLLQLREPVTEIESTLGEIVSRGIVFSDVPTILMHTTDHHDRVCQALRLGITDVIQYRGSLEILGLRLAGLFAEQERQSLRNLSVLQDMGTHGSLAHMNVIDLLQALGPGNKTIRISVTAEANQLTMYLHDGQLTYAECEGLEGAEAVYEALRWQRGIWNVDHIDVSDLPTPNVRRAIDSILIEGCYRLDSIRQDA